MILLRGQVALPKITLPLVVSHSAKQLVDDVMSGDRLIGLVTTIKPDEETPNPDTIYKVGTLPWPGWFSQKSPLSRLSYMSPQSAEYTVIKTYLDWLLDLPWNILSEDQLNISNARTILDEDH
jgi:ATP-dependent Lon protease